MKIFLTGGTGFIGCHFIKIALAEGHELICLRRPGSQPRITLANEPFWVEGYLENDWSHKMKDCDTLVHLAAVGVNKEEPEIKSCMRVNLNETVGIFEQARKSLVEKIIIAGSYWEYGQSAESYEFIPAEAPLKPLDTYAATKAAASVILIHLAKKYNISLQYLRLPQVYGEGEDKKRFWTSMRKAALAGDDFFLTAGEQIRDFTSVEEVAKKIFTALEFSNVYKGNPVVKNIGTGSPQTLREFAEYWWKKWDSKGKLHFGAKPYRKNELMRFVPEIEN